MREKRSLLLASLASSRSMAVVEAVDEIMRLYRSLPPRPTIADVSAASAVVAAATAGEESLLADVGRLEKPPDLPDDIFSVLQEARRNAALLASHELKWEALHVVELDRQFQVFDELIQRASQLVAGGKDEVNHPTELKPTTTQVAAAPLSSDATSVLGGGRNHLSLIMLASLIETSAENGTAILSLQGRLADQVEWLPLSLGKLVNVKEVNLSENRIMALPSTIGNLKMLRKLDISSNQIINLPGSFGGLSNLTNLELQGNRLKSLPTSFGDLTQLVNLDLSANQISALPDTFGNLINLRILNVEANVLEELPYTIGSCCSLVELKLDFNELKALPEEVGKLESLEILTLHYNRIKGLPTAMGSLLKLKELDVSFNELEYIPENLCFARSLVKLNLGRNFADLKALPRSIGNLEMLEELDISNNQIRVLPYSFRFLSKLRVFDADETPLEVPPRQMLKLGAQAVVEYMIDITARKDTSSHTAERKGCWFWFCSLFQLLRKDNNRDINSIQA